MKKRNVGFFSTAILAAAVVLLIGGTVPVVFHLAESTSSASSKQQHSSDQVAEESFDRPNILWLTFEDTGHNFLSQYGNPYVHTPTINKLAREGAVLTQARATAPHCSPARASIISGSYATTYGTDWHRTEWPVPHQQYYFPRLLRRDGYFTTNNSKTDYNVTDFGQHVDQVWSEQGSKATYNSDDRKQGQPFFSVFNQTSTHMGRIRSFHTEGRRDFGDFDVTNIDLPAYLPGLKPIRSDYGFLMEGVNEFDQWVALFMEDLKRRGLKDDTIIFLYSDHGAALPRAKGYPFDSGFRVPMIIWVPPKWRSRVDLPMGSRSDRLVGFEDLGPSVLRLAGLPIPEYMQGQDVLTTDAEPKQYQYNFRTNQAHHYDPVRTVTDGEYQYVRFYMPHRPLGLRQFYQWGVPSFQAWDRWCRRSDPCPPRYSRLYEPTPTEYLFNIEKDPWEMDNLAGDPQHQDILRRMRTRVSQHIRKTTDLGFFPRSTRSKGKEDQSLYAWVRTNDYPLEELYEAAETASRGDASNQQKLIEYLQSDYPAIRFWGASGFAGLAQRGKIEEAPPVLMKAANDSNSEVAITAAEALFYLGDTERSMSVLLEKARADHIIAGSSLQELAEVAPQKLRPYADQLLNMSEGRKGSVQPAEWSLATWGWILRSTLITLGEMDYSRLYDDRYEEGLGINKNRRNWRQPSPNPGQ